MSAPSGSGIGGGEAFEQPQDERAALGGEAVEVFRVVVGDEGVAHEFKGEPDFLGLGVE